MKKYLLFLFFITCFSTFSYAQEIEIDSISSKQTNFKNTFRFDISGRAFYYSLNYDRKFSVKKINLHCTIGIGDLSRRSISLNSTFYMVPNYWKINPILGVGHISSSSDNFPYSSTSLIFSGIEYNRMKRWNFQILITKLFFFNDPSNSQYFGGLSFGYKF